MRQSTAEALGLTPLARVVSQAAHAHEPSLFTTAPVPAMQKTLQKAGWSVDDVDLWEINEAFAVVPMIAMREMNIDHAKVNVNGGACALGHPIGASGARVLATLISALKARGGSKGVASLCIGGGEATDAESYDEDREAGPVGVTMRQITLAPERFVTRVERPQLVVGHWLTFHSA